MLLNARIIGIGAAGNKAVIELIKEVPELTTHVVLVNTTMKDIPEYREYAIELQGNYKGCAKERSVANSIMLSNLKSNTFDFLADSSDEAMTIIVTSSEGGTGSGASVMLAKYISSVYQSHIHFFIFTGFEDDARGLKNTVDLFKELDSSYTVEAISNKKFLEESHGNRIKAESLANKQFCKNIKTLLGYSIVESKQNIDESDLFKLVNTPGFMQIENINLGKIKNKENYNSKLIEAIDNTKSFVAEPTCKRFGTILNINEKESYFVDYDNEVLKERFGVPYEYFSHIQSVDSDNNIQVIVSGMKMPVEEIEEIYTNFMSSFDSVDKTSDEFFKKQFDTASDQFDTLVVEKSKSDINSAKQSFFKDMGETTTEVRIITPTPKKDNKEF